MEKRERRFGPSDNLVESLVGHTPTDSQWSDSLTRVPLKKSTGQIHNFLHLRPPSPPSLQIHEYGQGVPSPFYRLPSHSPSILSSENGGFSCFEDASLRMNNRYLLYPVLKVSAPQTFHSLVFVSSLKVYCSFSFLSSM